MKKVYIGVFFVIVCVGIYISFNSSENKESINTTKLYKSTVQKEKKINVDTMQKDQVVKSKKIKKDIKNTSEKVVTDSKILKNLHTYLNERNWDAFDEVYYTQIKKLREEGDHTLFYEQFKSFFVENSIPSEVEVAILVFLADASTKESIALIFEMFDEGIIADKDVVFNFVTHLANSTGIIEGDPSVDMKGVVEALQHGYQTTTNDYLRRGAAVMLGRYQTQETEVILFRDYMDAKTPQRKKAAYEGLMQLDDSSTDTLLPRLASYLKSDYEDVRKTSGMLLANMATDEAAAILSHWVIEEANIDHFTDIKRWYSQMIKTNGYYRVAKSLELGKIRSEELQTEIEIFLDDQLEKEKNRHPND